MTPPLMDGAGPYEGRKLEVTFGYAKAIWGGVLGFVLPGASYLLAQVLPGGDGTIGGNDWAVAGLVCIVGGSVTGGAVAAVTNKAKVVDKGPA